MEERKITLVLSKEQSTKTILSSANTLGELKTDLNAAGINHEGMAFHEGTSHTELLTNESPLPKDVPYKGNITNELVFMLTPKGKKIESGISERMALFNEVKKLGLQDEIKKHLGRNFTVCKSSDLREFIDAHKKIEAEKTLQPTVEAISNRDGLTILTNLLVEKEVLTEEERNLVLSGKIGEIPQEALMGEQVIDEAKPTSETSGFSSEEIRVMFE